MQAFVPDFPKLELGDPATHADRRLAWKVTVEQSMNPAGPYLIQWWKWCLEEAEESYKVFLRTGVHHRGDIIPNAPMPGAWLQLEEWMRLKILGAAPNDIREWVDMRARRGKVDAPHALLFYFMKMFTPGGAEEKVHLIASVLSPRVSSQPRAAQVDLLR